VLYFVYLNARPDPRSYLPERSTTEVSTRQFRHETLQAPTPKETGGVTLPRPARSLPSKKPVLYRAGLALLSVAAAATAFSGGFSAAATLE
jgi:hypothetical protein